MAEAIASMVILSIVALAASRILLVASDGFVSSSDRSALLGDMSVAMDRLAREVRQIQSESGSGGASIDAVAADRLDWQSDHSISVDAGNALALQTGVTTEVLLEGVTSLAIEAFDESGSALNATLD
ncbi:MAG: hypothetical protein AAGK04_13060, partial [Planctomycetota bacterium]